MYQILDLQRTTHFFQKSKIQLFLIFKTFFYASENSNEIINETSIKRSFAH